MFNLKEKFENSKFFKTTMVIVIILIPLIYSFFFLKAFWDPYGTLQDVKVGVVNTDKGYNGENKGKELQDKIIKKDNIKFEVVNPDDADTLLINQDYYAMIKIPEDFTKNLKSADSVEKKTTLITFSPNKKYNYIASQIIKTAVNTVEKEIRSEVSKTVVGKLSDNLNEIPEKMNDISNGTGQISNGAENLHTGLNQLNDGLSTLDEKYTEFDNGIDAVYNGSNDLGNGISQVNNGIDSLQNGANTLNSGLVQINQALNSADLSKLQLLTSSISQLNSGINGSNGLNNGINTYVSGTENLAKGITTLNSNLDTMINSYQTLLSTETDPQKIAQYQIQIATIQGIKNNDGYKSIVNGATQLITKDSQSNLTVGDKLKNGTNKISNGISQLNSSTSEIQNLGSSIELLKNSLKQVENGSGDLAVGVATLKNGQNQVQNGSKSLTNGLSTLKNSSKDVKSALEQLSSGSKSAVDGSEQLANGINILKTSVDDGVKNSREELKKLTGLDEFTSNPVQIEEVDHGDVPTYGVGFAPYFVSLSLWVGALVAFVVLYFDEQNRFKHMGIGAKNKFLRTGLYGGLAIIQGLSLGLLLKLSIGYSVSNVFLYYGSCILIAILFLNIIEFLIVTFGDLGKFISFILLVIQLVATGGTFPVETIPVWLQKLNAYLPMTYTIRLIKESFAGIDSNLLSKNFILVFVLTLIFIGINAFNDVTRKSVEIIKEKKEK